MGEKAVFQPLTREDKITVVIYRTGIVLSALFMSGLAYFLAATPGASGRQSADMLGYGLYLSVGLSVVFIHLYISKFKKFLLNLYYLSLGSLAALLYLGKWSLSGALAHDTNSALLLLPLAGCLGFVTAKEAFCFRLFEGYLLAMLMPAYLLLLAGDILTRKGAVSGLVVIAALLVLFTLRKVFMPVAYDLGDKSAYQ